MIIIIIIMINYYNNSNNTLVKVRCEIDSDLRMPKTVVISIHCWMGMGCRGNCVVLWGGVGRCGRICVGEIGQWKYEDKGGVESLPAGWRWAWVVNIDPGLVGESESAASGGCCPAASAQSGGRSVLEGSPWPQSSEDDALCCSL